MTLRKYLSLICFLCSSTLSFAGSVEYKSKYKLVEPADDYKVITISKRDINRIYCPDGIRFYQTSSEKFLAVSFDENDPKKRNMFIKIKPKLVRSEDGSEEYIVYDSHPKDLYLKCGDTVYTFVLKPLDIPARTIYIKKQNKKKSLSKKIKPQPKKALKDASIRKIKKNPVKNMDLKKAIEFDKRATSYEDSLVNIVKVLLKKGEVPGYKEEKINKQIDSFKQGNLYLLKIFEGPVYRVYLYSFLSKVDIDKPLYEREFAYLSKKPLAISIEDLVLRKGDSTRIILIESVETPVIIRTGGNINGLEGSR